MQTQQPYRVTLKNKGDECSKTRCTRPLFAEGLCDRHHKEWVLLGRPPFTTLIGLPAIHPPEPMSGPKAKAQEELAHAEAAYEHVRAMAITNRQEAQSALEWLHAVRARLETDLNRDKAEATATMRSEIQRIEAFWSPAEEAYRGGLALLESRLRAFGGIDQGMPRYKPEGEAPAPAPARVLRPTSSVRPPARAKKKGKRGR